MTAACWTVAVKITENDEIELIDVIKIFQLYRLWK